MYSSSHYQARRYADIFYGSRLGDGLRLPPLFNEHFGHYWQHRINLSEPGNYSVVIPTLNPNDLNSVVNVFFQVQSI